MFSAFTNCFKIPELRQRIIFTLVILVFVRLGASIPCPGINTAVLGEYFTNVVDQQKQGNLVGMINLFSGGALENCAIFSLTIMPYISASILFQVAQAVIPSIGRLAQEEGGRQKITQYIRYITLLFCLIQGFFLAKQFEVPPQQLFPGLEGVMKDMGSQLVQNPGWGFRFVTVVTLTTGTMFLMWLGEQITDKGIGNGVSLIIAVGILSKLPSGIITGINQFFPGEGSTTEALPEVLLVLLVAFLFAVVAATIMITQAMRKVPVSYAKQVRGNRMYGGQNSFLPLKVNYAGVMPLIFASTLIIFPSTIATMLFPESKWAIAFSNALIEGWLYYFINAGMIFFFSYFWVALMFNPTKIADDMKKSGGFIPGIRPGEPTARFLDFSMTRLTFFGAIFLTVLALLPMVLMRSLNVPMITANFFGGTGLLIIVGVMLDTMRQSETYLLQRHYDGFLKKGRMRGRTSGAARYQTGEALAQDKMVWLLVIVAIIILGGVVASLYA